MAWADEIVWGWDPLPGLVGLWVDRDGRVTRWRRDPTTATLRREQTRFRPWALLPSLAGLRAARVPFVQRPTLPHEPSEPSALRSPIDDAATTDEEDRRVSPHALWAQPLAGVGRLRYLISAPHADQLEHALRQALTHTLGRPVMRLSAVDPDDLLLLPLEDQYLTFSGQVYFRGLAWGDVHRLTFDLETEGLDPARHRVFLIAVRDTRGLSTILDIGEAEARGLRGDAAEADLLRRFVALVQERDPDVLENHNLAGFDLPFLMERARRLRLPLALQRSGLPAPFFRAAPPARAWGGWRAPAAPAAETAAASAALDTTYGAPPEARQLPAADPPEPSRRRGRVVVPGREIIDTLDAVRRYDFSARSLPGHGLKAVARALGVAPPDREYLEGAQVSATWQVDPARVRRYAQDDVTEAAAVSALLGGPAFALAQMAPRRYERVAEAGPATGLLDPLLVRAYLRAGAALPAYRPRRATPRITQSPHATPSSTDPFDLIETTDTAEQDDAAEVFTTPDAPHSGGATYLFAAGVARQVVKCDVASLYPSLIIHHRLQPQRDTLGAFLTLVEQLVAQRLRAKRHAQTAPVGSTEQKTQAGLAAGLKIVINAAYGYLAAPGLCRLADVAVANQVTGAGRDTLDHLCRELAARGVTLLEADTDGVYFAAPDGWTEEDERRCVAEVAATLPPLVSLEYEARYAAMLSHEVKNYATLSFDGALTLRGVAFHSRRMEPYGEAFLRQALRCLLSGDIPGVRAAYLDTIVRLRRRTIPIEQVTIRARLSKTPEHYQRTRAARREAVYEAVLSSGQTTWTVGETAQYYCVGGGRFALWRPPATGDRDDDNSLTDSLPGAIGAGVGAVAGDLTRALSQSVAPDVTRPLSTRNAPPPDKPYDVGYYCAQLRTLYAQRLARAFTPEDFATVFANPDQPSLFDTPLETIHTCLTPLMSVDALSH